MIDLVNDLVLIGAAAANGRIVVHIRDEITLRISQRVDGRNICRNLAETAGRNDIAGKCVPREAAVRQLARRERIGDRYYITGGVAGLREIPLPFPQCRHGGDGRRAIAVPVVLPVREEERLVFLYRSANRCAVLVLDQVRPGIAGAILEKVVCVEIFIANKFIRRSMELVRSGLDAHANDRAGGSAKLRGKGVGLHLKLLCGVDGRDERRRVHLGQIERQALDHYRIGIGQSAVG